jgi:hypothetical protein
MGAPAAGSLDRPASEYRRRGGGRGRRRGRRVVKLVGLPVFLFCGNLAVIAWKARRHAARRLG